MNNESSKGRDGNDKSSEVDDLLRAAEDHLLLNLRVGSHSKSQNPFSSPSSSSFSLDSDLTRRFDALKSPPNPNPNPNPDPPKSLKQSQERKGIAADEDSSGILGDELAARFAALKGGSLGPPPNLGLEQEPDRARIFEDSDDDDDVRDGDGVSKKEVEKLMEWAKDAARLDPSSKSDDEEDAHDDEEDEDEDDDSDDSEEERRKAKEKSKGKPKPKSFHGSQKPTVTISAVQPRVGASNKLLKHTCRLVL